MRLTDALMTINRSLPAPITYAVAIDQILVGKIPASKLPNGRWDIDPAAIPGIIASLGAKVSAAA